MIQIDEITPNFSTGPQIALDDLETIKALGFTDVICNRPDAELGIPPLSSDFEARAKELGLGFQYLPIATGEDFEAAALGLQKLLAEGENRKVFSYCLSGKRSQMAYGLIAEG